MQQNHTLISKHLSELKNFTFYRQRFDACPHFMFFVGDAHGSNTNHSKYPYGQRITCAYFSQNKADWYHPYSELQYSATMILEEARKNSHLVTQMIEEFKPWENKFYKECLNLNELDFSKLSNKELIDLYEKISFIYTKKLNSSPLIDGFALSTDTLVASKVEEFFEQKGMLKEFVRSFEIFTAPTFISFLQEEELDFLKLMQKINKKNEDELIKNHQKKYFWIHNNYVKDNILDENFFREKLVLYKDVDINKRINELENVGLQNKTRKEKLIQELRLPFEIVVLLEMTDKFNAWQDERKKGTFWATHYFSFFLKEIAWRTKYTIEELKYAMPTEMKNILEGKISHEELQKRFAGCFLIWTKDSFDLTTDQNLIEEIITRKEETKTTNELRGMSVSLGVVTGRVKVVNSVDEISKVHKGDILVAVMTRPDYIMAMEKAAAFITDEGGLTCHAAIVARELHLPCIVGTRIATKVLKDGDLVRVDANHGWIKIIS